MPENLKRNPEELWQLDEHSPFPDEVEIVVLDDRPFKGYIKPKGDLDTPFTKDNIIEVNPMFLIAYLKKKTFQRELWIDMYKAEIFSKKDFTYSLEQFFLKNLRWRITYRFIQNLAGNEYCRHGNLICPKNYEDTSQDTSSI